MARSAGCESSPAYFGKRSTGVLLRLSVTNIFDVAKAAGVSPSAVSRYLNNGYLSDEKREAIEDAIGRLNYRPSVHAQYLRTQKTGTIGVIVPKIDSFSVANVVAGIDKVLEERNLQLLLADTHNMPERELDYLDLLSDHRTDGIILLGSIQTDRHREAISSCRVPVVIAGQNVAYAPCVYHDDFGAFRAITNLLIEKGRHKLGFIGAEYLDEAVGERRRNGFLQALQKAGLDDQMDHIVYAEFSIRSGFDKAKQLLNAYGPLDGIICATDTIAIGTLKYLRQAGLRVPEEVMVTGQGGADICEAITPTLTTIRYFYEKSGEVAAGMIIDLIGDDPPEVESEKLPYEIIEHASTNG